MDSIALSVGDAGEWDKSLISIKYNREDVSVRNVFSLNQFLVHKKWIEELKPVELIECSIPVSKKSVHITDDHGKDKLKEFCDKNIRSPYVCSVRSTSYSVGIHEFIKKVCTDGAIEIVLPWTDKGLSVVVKTTGRNMREIRAIAEILKDKYGKR